MHGGMIKRTKFTVPIWGHNHSGDYWGDFDYCDSIAIVRSTIAILLRYLWYYCDSIAIVR